LGNLDGVIIVRSLVLSDALAGGM